MRATDLRLLVCPQCRQELRLRSTVSRGAEEVMEGELRCSGCGVEYPLRRGVPRFVPSDNYASSFGLQWTRHAQTQRDSHSGLRLSETRFFEETRWPHQLAGQVILEVGSGSGRFTEPAASTGAFVVSMDYSQAVDANYQGNGSKPNVLIVQGDVYRMPFRPGSFDKLFCFGMLQHTPDVRGAFMALPPMLKPGGHLVVDVYKKTLAATLLATKYYARVLTRRMEPERLYALTRRWIDLVWPLSRLISRIPRAGRLINWRLLVADYSALGLSDAVLKEWAVLDTFDMLSPRYDSPQTLATLRRWFVEAGLTDIDVHYGYNGIEARARKP
jgi:2-polyprenyl-3-methyl-5-hydroxy-6-metoxy-1,4-benzoquinol methylase/uncharacterized protein YbaR (Trm112 family)